MKNTNVYVAKELIQNYNAANAWYKKTGAEVYNNVCLGILKQVDKLSENAQDIFHSHTKVKTVNFETK